MHGIFTFVMSPRICTSTKPFGSAMKMQVFSQRSPWLLLFRGRHFSEAITS